MNTDTKSLAFGGLFGGTISGLLWLAIAWQYGFGLWAIVPVSLVGGCFGWLACDFADAKRSVKIAWKQVVEWKPDVKWWKDFLLLGGMVFSFVFSFCFWLFLSIVNFDGAILFLVDAEVSAIFATFFTLVATGAYALTGAVGHSKDEKKFIKTILIHWNIVTLPFSLAWYFGNGAWWFLAKVPFALKTAGKFWWHAFILAHSSKRRICFIGTTLGAIAGLLFASMSGINLVVGVVFPGIFGAVFSLAWNEIVAVRWPGIKPV